MKFLANLFKKPEPRHPDAKTHVVEAKGRDFAAEKALKESGTGLRIGMWVQTPEGLGIITDFDTFTNTSLVALVDEDGLTKIHIRKETSEMKQAHRSALPKKRVAHMGDEHFDLAGY